MKKASAIAAFCAVLCMCAVLWAADDEPAVNFTGTWILDAEKSDPFPRPLTEVGFGGGGFPGGGFPGGGAKRGPTPPPAQAPPLVIEHNGTQVKVTRTVFSAGKAVPVTEIFPCDGKKYEEMVPVTNSDEKVRQEFKATLKKNKLEVQKTTHYSKYTSKAKSTYILSKDGQSLTLKTENNPQGTMIMLQNQIYNRQAK